MYDVIVIGNDISSLIATARAMQRGFKTALIRDNPLPCDFSIEDYTFEMDPLPWPILNGLDHFPFLQGFSSVNMDKGDQGINLQVIGSEHRIDILSNQVDMIKELTREIPDRSKAIPKLYRAINETGSSLESHLAKACNSNYFSSQLKYLTKLIRLRINWSIQKKHLREFPVLKRILACLVCFLSNDVRNITLPMSSVYLLYHALKGSPYTTESKRSILENIRKYLLNSEGNLFENCTVEKLSTGRKIEISIQTKDGDFLISGKNLILSPKWKGLNQIEDSKIMNWIKRKSECINETYYPYTIHLGVNERAFPEKIARYVILHPEENSIFSLNPSCLIFLELSASGDLTRAPLGKRALSATVFLPTSPWDIDLDHFRSISGLTLGRISTFLPFLKENIDKLDFEKSFSFIGTFQEIAHSKIISRNNVFCFSNFLRNNAKKNVIFIGGKLFLTLGAAGEILSGIHAANLLSGGKD